MIQFHTRVFGLKYSDVSMVQATLPQEDYGLVKVEQNNRRILGLEGLELIRMCIRRRLWAGWGVLGDARGLVGVC